MTHKLSDSELLDESETTYGEPSPANIEVIEELDDHIDEEPLNDEQREVMEDIWLKAEEMGMWIKYVLSTFTDQFCLSLFAFRY